MILCALPYLLKEEHKNRGRCHDFRVLTLFLVIDIRREASTGVKAEQDRSRVSFTRRKDYSDGGSLLHHPCENGAMLSGDA